MQGNNSKGDTVFRIICSLFAGVFIFASFLAIKKLQSRKSTLITLSPNTGNSATFPSKVTRGGNYRVVRITDGDTVIVADDASLEFKVRLEGIDAPEHDQPFGSESKQFLTELLSTGRVSLTSRSTDKYGRHLGSLYNDRGWVNLLMVKQGAAWVYGEQSKTSELVEAETSAKNLHLGLWKDSRAINPHDWRIGTR